MGQGCFARTGTLILPFGEVNSLPVQLRGIRMAATVDELTIRYVDGGVELVKELDKVVLSKGAWTTVLFKYQDWDGRKQDYGPVRFSIRRYQKRNDRYQQKSKFNISSADQARKLIAALEGWTGEH